MMTIGMLARYALATPVTASVSPGPAVTIATPGWPVTRAQPSAACAADLLVAHVDDADALVEAAVVDRHDVPAAEREDVRHALLLERARDDPSSVHRHVVVLRRRLQPAHQEPNSISLMSGICSRR